MGSLSKRESIKRTEDQGMNQVKIHYRRMERSRITMKETAKKQ